MENENTNQPIIPNGIITLINAATGTFQCVQILTILRGNLQGNRIASLMDGPDDKGTCQGFAFVKEDGRVFVWKKYRTANGQSTEERVGAILSSLFVQGESSPYYNRVQVEMTKHLCLLCNRELTDDESKERGVDSECWQTYQ